MLFPSSRRFALLCVGSCLVSIASADSDDSIVVFERVLKAHGTVMGLAFVIFFPFGALAIRLFRGTKTIWIHVCLQTFAYSLALAGFGMGVWMAVTQNLYDYKHPIIGTVVIGLLLLQPVLGFIHHRVFLAKHIKTWWARVHVGLGRVLLILGIINGGFGLQLTDNTRKGEIGYGVVAGFVFLFYATVIAFVHLRDRRNTTRNGKARGRDEPMSVGASSRQMMVA